MIHTLTSHTQLSVRKWDTLTHS